eukprot:5520252-Pleurochrysis_carterae.AAC.1
MHSLKMNQEDQHLAGGGLTGEASRSMLTAALCGLKVPELKEALRKAGMRVTGRKAELQASRACRYIAAVVAVKSFTAASLFPHARSLARARERACVHATRVVRVTRMVRIAHPVRPVRSVRSVHFAWFVRASCPFCACWARCATRAFVARLSRALHALYERRRGSRACCRATATLRSGEL